MDIGELLAFGVKNGASDLHLSAGLPPMIRVDGDVRRINVPSLEHKQVHDLVKKLKGLSIVSHYLNWIVLSLVLWLRYGVCGSLARRRGSDFVDILNGVSRDTVAFGEVRG